jgi:ribosomal protein L11 methyltransferase
MSDWIEITATGPRKKGEEATAVLIGAGSPGVLEVDGGTSAVGKLLSHSAWGPKEPGYEPGVEPGAQAGKDAPLSPKASFKAYLPADKPEKIEPLRKDLKRLGWSFSTEFFKDRDWSVKWRTGLKPVHVTSGGSSIIIKPTWCAAAKRPGDIVIEIDPGMAFGTGSHATTKMCLKAIKALLDSKKGLRTSLLDVGTGTGVLAIAAKKLKVKKAVGTDIDAVALKVARKNLRLNRAAVTLSARPVEKVPGLFSIVVANILAGELIRLSPALFSKVMPGGALVLSGILKEEAGRVKEAFCATGLRHSKTYLAGEWAALVFSKPARVG